MNAILLGLLFYGSLAILTGALAELSIKLQSKKKRLLFLGLTLLLPSLVAGFRYDIGTDYDSYVEIFKGINNNESTKVDNEFIFVFLNKIVGMLGMDFAVVMFLASFITTSFIYLALWNYRIFLSVGLGMMVYMFLYYQVSFNIVRQIVALAILLYSVQFIHKREFWKFTLFTLIAVGFHITAVLFYPMYFLFWLFGRQEYHLLKILAFIGLTIVMIFYPVILYPIVDDIEALSYYADSYLRADSLFNIGLGFFVRTFPFVIAGIVFWKKIIQFPSMILYFNLVIIGSISLLSSYKGAGPTERISYYFLSALIIFVPFIYRESKKSGHRYIGYAVLGVIIFLWFWDFIYMGRNETIPYRWVFLNFYL